MNCPHCQKELPQDYESPWCPYCGKNLPGASSEEVLVRKKFPWLLFSIAIAAPAIADLILAMFPFQGLEALNFIAPITFLGSAIAGIGAGIIFAQWKNAKGLEFLMQIIGYSIAMAFVSFCLCFLGCATAGFIQSEIHTISR